MGKSDDSSTQGKLSVIDNFQQDYIDFINRVQDHAKCSSAYCVKVDQYDKQHCRFFYLFDNKKKTCIKYTTESSKSGFNSDLKQLPNEMILD